VRARRPDRAAHDRRPPQAAKLRLTDRLPRAPGVYLFRDRGGRTLYVGKATDLRSRVRSYFSGDERRKVGQLLREVERIDHVVCPSPLEAAVLEVRLIHRLEPRFNRQATTWRRYAYLKLTNEVPAPLGGAHRPRRRRALPRPAVVRGHGEAGSRGHRDRRAPASLHRQPRPRHPGAPCTAAQLGVATCPCAGRSTPPPMAGWSPRSSGASATTLPLLLGPLEVKMHALAAQERFEEAADVRDRAAALAAALRRQQRFDALRRLGRVVLEIDGTSQAELRRGRLVRTWRLSARGIDVVPLPWTWTRLRPTTSTPPTRRPHRAGHPASQGAGRRAQLRGAVARPPSPPDPHRARRCAAGASRADAPLVRTGGSLAAVRWFLVSLLGIVGTLIVLACIVVLLVRHRISRRNRVDPKVATAAPATWLADPRTAARLHRRLVRAGRTAGAVAGDHRANGRFRRTSEQPPIVDAALALRAHAVRLDHEVTRAALLAPGPRRTALARVATAVDELETASTELVVLSAEILAPPVLATEADHAIDLAGQIRRLAEAHRALLDLDAANGLVPEPPPAPMGRPAANGQR
jgi:hypothetical protein